MGGSVLEVGEGVVELSLQFEYFCVFYELYLLQFFTEVENVHGSYFVVDVLWYFAVDLDAGDGVILPPLFPEGVLTDIFLCDDFASEHSFDVGHEMNDKI